MKTLFRKIHCISGLSVGILIATMCITGAILVFQSEIQQMLRKDVYYSKTVSTPSQTLSLEQLQQQFPNIVSITEYSAANRTWIVTQKNGEKSDVLYIDPYTATVQAENPAGLSFFSTVRRLHRFFLLDSKIGSTISGSVTLIFILITLTGLIRKGITCRKRGWFTPCPCKKSLYAKLWNQHTVVSLFFVLPLLAMMLTGPYWSFGWYRTAFGTTIESILPKKEALKEVEIPQDETADWNNIQQIVSKIKEEYSDFQDVTVVFPKADKNTFTVTVRPGYMFSRSNFDQYTYSAAGTLLSADLSKEREASRKVGGIVFTLHSGGFGGMIVKIFYFVSALFGAWLAISGSIMFFRRRYTRKKYCGQK